MTLTESAFARPRFSAVAMVVLLLIGITLFIGFPSQEDPDFTIREAVVTAYFPGMAPDRIEDLIARRIEEEIRRIPEVEHITSSSRTGVAVVHATVHDHFYDLQPIWQDLRNRMTDLGAELPEGTHGPHVDDDFGRVAVATLALSGDGFDFSEMEDVAERLRDAIYSVPGTSHVVLHGVQEERILLEVSSGRMAQLGFSAPDLIQTLTSQNVILPGGSLEVEGQDIVFEPTGTFDTLADIEQLVIALPGQVGVVYLGDIVTVRRAFVDPPVRPVFFDGESVVLLEISMVGGENIVAYGETLSRRVAEFESRLPIGYRLRFATFQPGLVDRSISGFLANLYQTIAIVLVVVVLFLGVRVGLIVGGIVPLAILGTLPFMSALDIPLHSVSIAALIISLGLLVDNGVVVAEEIRTRIGRGEDRREAALAAGGALALPLLTSSLTTVLAFMPLLLAQNQAGEYTRSLSQVVGLTLMVSWFLSMTVTPLLCYWFVPEEPGDGSGDPRSARLYERYRHALRMVLRHRAIFLGTMGAALAVAVLVFGALPTQFFPESERDQYLVFLDLPAGSNIRSTQAETLHLAEWLGDPDANPAIENHVAYVGYGGPRFVLNFSPPDPAPHRAVVLVNVREGADLEAQVERTRAHLLAGYPDVRARVEMLAQGPADPGAVAIRIIGPERGELFRLSADVSSVFREVQGIANLRDDWENPTRKVVVHIDQGRARQAAISSEEIASALTALFDGSEVSEFREGDRSLPIVIRSDEAGRRRLDQLATMNVFSTTSGTAVPLLQVSSFDLVWQFGDIRRRDMERTVTVTAKHSRLGADELIAQVQPSIDALNWPSGYRYEVGGELEDSANAQAALLENVPLCGALILVLLVWQFDSIRRPLLIVLTIPLSMIGAVTGLLITGAPFGFMPMLGLLSLAGIIINNAIVLIDRIDEIVDSGARPDDAIEQAALQRVRPIVMTTLTTILGLLPLMFFGGPLWFGMAVVLVFGLGVGTVLTLGVIPVLYAVLFRVPRA